MRVRRHGSEDGGGGAPPRGLEAGGPRARPGTAREERRYYRLSKGLLSCLRGSQGDAGGFLVMDSAGMLSIGLGASWGHLLVKKVRGSIPCVHFCEKAPYSCPILTPVIRVRLCANVFLRTHVCVVFSRCPSTHLSVVFLLTDAAAPACGQPTTGRATDPGRPPASSGSTWPR